MIKPEELRVGNLVNVLSESDNILLPTGQTIKISEITWEGVTEILPKREKNIKLNYRNIDPIPLNEDWLFKFGFEREGQVIGRLRLDTDFGISIIDFNNLPNHCKYVHQFQNLYFVLTGEELKIRELV